MAMINSVFEQILKWIRLGKILVYIIKSTRLLPISFFNVMYRKNTIALIKRASRGNRPGNLIFLLQEPVEGYMD